MNVNWKDYAGFAIPPRLPCCDCPASCGYFNITTGLEPFYFPGTLSEAEAALAEYAIGCHWFNYPISSDYAYSVLRSYSFVGSVITLIGGVDSVAPANNASFNSNLLIAMQAGTFTFAGTYSSYCSAGVNVTSSVYISITGTGFFEEYTLEGPAFSQDIIIPSAGCYTVYISVSTQCECPPPIPPSPPPECYQTAGVSIHATLTMDNMVPSDISIDYLDGVDTVELPCT